MMTKLLNHDNAFAPPHSTPHPRQHDVHEHEHRHQRMERPAQTRASCMSSILMLAVEVGIDEGGVPRGVCDEHVRANQSDYPYGESDEIEQKTSGELSM